MATGPLAGVRILEFSGIGPGPFCGMLLSDMGADVLRIDPSSKALQDASALLARASDALAKGDVKESRDALDRAATGVASALRSYLLDAPSGKTSPDLDRLSGALNDALRRPRGMP